MTKTYLIFGIALVLLIAGSVLVREKRQGSVEPAPVTPPISQPPVVTPTPPIVAPPITPTIPAPTPEGWKTYENKEFGFAFDYPGDVDTGTNAIKDDLGGVTQVIISIGYPGGFNITIEKSLKLDILRENIKKSFPNTIEQEIFIDEFRAIKFFHPEGRNRKILVVHPYRENIIIIISPDSISNGEKILYNISEAEILSEKILYSFRFFK